MNDWLEWGIPVIVWLQSLGDWLRVPMEAFSFLGTENFYLLIFPGLLWCYDARLGYRLGLILLTSVSLNGALKQLFGWPRPYWVSEAVRGLAEETSFGIPSGHAQNAMALWGRLAAALQTSGAYIGLGLLIAMVSISRLYLGVHFPTDVIVGLAIGALLLWGFLRYEEPAGRWLKGRPLRFRLLAAFLGSLALLVVSLAVWGIFRERPIPFPLPQGADPYNIGNAFAFAGVWFGVAAGGALLFEREEFDAGGPALQRAARFVLGVIGVVVIFFGLRVVLPRGEDLTSQVLRYLRYCAVGLWVTYLAPWLFIRLRLA